jgi:ribosomal-protein-alanine N-acetyltransferase
MKNMEIREMMEQDLDGILEVEKLSFHTPWSRDAFEKELRENRLARYVVGIIDGKVVGYCGVWLIVDEGHITNVAVHPDFRGHGVGKKLVRALIDLCKSEGIEKMTLEVRVNNEVAIKLYEGFDFRGVGVRKGYYTDTHEDALIMWRGETEY